MKGLSCDPPKHQTPGFSRPGVLIGIGETAGEGATTFFNTAATDPFGVAGSLAAYLRNATLMEQCEDKGDRPVPRIRNSGREVESLSTKDFLGKIEEIQRIIGVTEVLLLELDRKAVFDVGLDPPGDLENLSEVTRKTIQGFFNKDRREPKVIHIESYGKTESFILHLTIRFRRAHATGDPAITIGFFALPKVLWKQEGESEFFYQDRINELMNDNSAICQIEEDNKQKILALLGNTKLELISIFDIERMEESVNVDFSSLLI